LVLTVNYASAHVKKCGSLQASQEMDVVTFVFWCDF
jgi:hypothetical protein